MECCYPVNCGEYTVTPVLVAPSGPPKCCEEVPMCYPCLPRCQKPVMYCCEVKPSRPQTPVYDSECCHHSPPPARCCAPRCPPPKRQEPCPQPAQSCNSCCHTPCKPVKTKYIIPCYRYEDGRITNQPTVLMHRACEVACGARARRKPFVVSTYAADPYHEERRYHCEDERGNCCFHFERNKPTKSCNECGPCPPCVSSPHCQYTDCVYARPVDTPSCCYYCR